MKFPNKIRTFCPYCNKHTEQKVKMASKGRPRAMAAGNRRHEEKLKGYVGKVAGKKTVRKQGKRQKVILQCAACNKKQERIIGGRTKNKLEIKG